jgi:hypothetical protein
MACGDAGAWYWTDATLSYPTDQVVLAPEMLMHTNSNQVSDRVVHVHTRTIK